MLNQRKITLKDVAKQAGVSRSTVSAVLTGKSDHVRVSETTRARVWEIAQQMGYHPNVVARSLRHRRTDIIGIYGGSANEFDLRNTFRAELIGGMQQGCNHHRKDLLLHGAFRVNSVDDLFSNLMDGRIEGLIVYARPDDPLVERLANSQLPVVSIVDPIPGLPSVVVDNEGGARMLVDYLYQQGHRRVIYRAFNEALTSLVRRQNAFREAAAQQGMEVLEWSAGAILSPDDWEKWNEWNSLRPSARPTAIACWNDKCAYEMLTYLRDRGMRIPDDMAVAGFDGLIRPLTCAWNLTTIRTDSAGMAQKAIDLLVAQLNGERISPETTLPVSLIPGDTV